MSPRPRAGRHVRPFAKSQHQGQPGPGGAPPAADKRASGWRHGRAWPRRDGGDGLLGRGGIVHTRRAQARAHAEAGAGASRRHRWASAAARPGSSRRHLAHASRSAAVPPALCWPGPWKGPQSRARPAAPRPGCPHFHAGPRPPPSSPLAGHCAASRCSSGIAPRRNRPPIIHRLCSHMSSGFRTSWPCVPLQGALPPRERGLPGGSGRRRLSADSPQRGTGWAESCHSARAGEVQEGAAGRGEEGEMSA